MIKVLTVFGTRPEAIKLAPVVKELKRRKVRNKVCITAQHRQMLEPFLKLFDIGVDYDLDIMKHNQDLYHITTEVLLKLREVLQAERPDLVIVQGDTTTTFIAALASFYEKIPIAHVEAGLRTGCKYNPFPEEINRRLTDHLADWLFAPTKQAYQNLIAEGVSNRKIFITGNTVVDALLMVLTDKRFQKLKPPVAIPKDHRLILVTVHRRESFGYKLKNICQALRQIVENNRDVEIVYPVHLNPYVQETVYRILNKVERIHLLPPLEYLPFLKMMKQAYLVLTDSGGVQEEAPTLGKPVLVMREETERPEVIKLGLAKLIGTKTKHIVQEAQRLLDSRNEYKKMTLGRNPYGDGKAAKYIVGTLLRNAL